MGGDSTSDLSFQTANDEFQRAWNDPNHTRFVLPAVNINRVLKERYRVRPDRPVTRAEIWDMEVKKAWDPLTYIPYVVSQGSSWGRTTLADGSDHWLRASHQVGWITEQRGLVLEEVFVSHRSQAIFFMGRPKMTKPDGNEIWPSNYHQPLFHVQHGVGGTESMPENLWRIVLLTGREDRRFHEPFNSMVKTGWLPGFIEIYLERDLSMTLTRQ
jgi:hypothetical protein